MLFKFKCNLIRWFLIENVLDVPGGKKGNFSKSFSTQQRINIIKGICF